MSDRDIGLYPNDSEWLVHTQTNKTYPCGNRVFSVWWIRCYWAADLQWWCKALHTHSCPIKRWQEPNQKKIKNNPNKQTKQNLAEKKQRMKPTNKQTKESHADILWASEKCWCFHLSRFLYAFLFISWGTEWRQRLLWGALLCDIVSGWGGYASSSVPLCVGMCAGTGAGVAGGWGETARWVERWGWGDVWGRGVCPKNSTDKSCNERKGLPWDSMLKKM